MHPGRPEWEDESELRAELPGAHSAVKPAPESAALNGGVKRGHEETLNGYTDEAEDGECLCMNTMRKGHGTHFWTPRYSMFEHIWARSM